MVRRPRRQRCRRGAGFELGLSAGKPVPRVSSAEGAGSERVGGTRQCANQPTFVSRPLSCCNGAHRVGRRELAGGIAGIASAAANSRDSAQPVQVRESPEGPACLRE